MRHHFKRYFPASYVCLPEYIYIYIAYVIQPADTYVVVSDIEMCVCVCFF